MPPSAPRGLQAAGRKVWRSIVSKYELRPDELETLEDVCRTTDLVVDLTSRWEDLGSPATSKGSMGQEVIHPLIGEIRAQRMARNALWRQLKLPDDPAAGGAAPVNQQRDAATTKWATGRGRGA